MDSSISAKRKCYGITLHSETEADSLYLYYSFFPFDNNNRLKLYSLVLEKYEYTLFPEILSADTHAP